MSAFYQRQLSVSFDCYVDLTRLGRIVWVRDMVIARYLDSGPF
jgi:hypothetical protein